MKPEPNSELDKYRLDNPGSDEGANWGAFQTGGLRIISSGVDLEFGHGWEHVSVSRADQCPTWEQMDRVKRMFWSDDETVIQFHPKQSKYVNQHPYCLHLWKQINVDHELPPRILI